MASHALLSNSLTTLTCILLLLIPARAEDKVKVYILAGQSNMVGKAKNKLLEHQAKQEHTKAAYAKYRNNNQWIVRNDVSIKFGKLKGGLSTGYGARDRTGVELAFGTQIGNHHKEHVLLIKTAWGGHSLARKFRSPSAGLPSDAALRIELAKAIKRTERLNAKHKRNTPLPTMESIKAVYGSSYRQMLEEVMTTIAQYETLFPALKGKKIELSGFVWFQGWNDQYNGAEAEYASNMKHFIEDVRKDFQSPKLPFVIAVMGQNGATPATGPMKIIQEAQLSMEQVPAFKGNVRAIKTDILEDQDAAKVYLTWKENKELWEQTGSDARYHYLGSGIWFNRIGESMAKAMLEIAN